ncbi:hypothetical protein L9F63_017191, partial [Diploptera punctata]
GEVVNIRKALTESYTHSTSIFICGVIPIGLFQINIINNNLHMIVSRKIKYYRYLSGNSWRGAEKYDSSALFQQVSTNGSNGRRRCKKATTAEQTSKSGRLYRNSSSRDEQRNEKQLAFYA